MCKAVNFEGDIARRRFLLGAGLITGGAGLALGVAPAASAAPAATASGTFSLRDFGAVGDDKADDAPALQAALEALADAGGGVLLVPPGVYRISSSVSCDFSRRAAAIVLRGHGSSAQLHIACGSDTVALTLANLESVLLEDLLFVGTPGARTDARATLTLTHCAQALVHRCDFYGLSSTVTNGAVLRAVQTDLRIQSSAFRGCGGNSGAAAAVVRNDDSRAVTVTDTSFVDYGYLNGVFHSKTPIAAPEAWIRVGNVQSPQTFLGGHVHIARVFMDEGALFGVACLPNASVSPKLESVIVSGLSMNGAGFTGARAVHIQWARNVLIEHSRFGYTPNLREAIFLRQVDAALIDGCQCRDGMNRISADNEVRTLTVRESVYAELASEATETRVLKGGTESWQMRTSGEIAANSLVVADPTRTRTVMIAPAGSQSSVILGVALDSTPSAGGRTRVVRTRGPQVTVRSDGTATIVAGDAIAPSRSLPGRVRPVRRGPFIGYALGPGYASTSVSVPIVLLAGVKEADGAVVAAELQNGWQNLGGSFADAAFYVDNSDHVHLVGMIRNGTTVPGTVLFRLPPAYRPKDSAEFPVHSGSLPSSLLVRSDGIVSIRSDFSSEASLEGVVFRIAG